MAGSEDQPQQVVADVIGACRVQPVDKVGLDVVAASVGICAELVVLAHLQRLQAQVIQCLVFCDGHEPGTGILGHPGARPVLEGGNQCLLCKIFRQANVSHQSRDAANNTA